MLRFLIAKHFLTKSLDEIHADQRATGTFKLRLLARTQIFHKALNKVFPKRSNKRTMGEKYEALTHEIDLHQPFYKNTYIAHMVRCHENTNP